MADSKEIQNYLQETRYIVLATVNEQGAPAVRTLGSFVAEGLNVYFSTGTSTTKVEQISANPQVAVLFQQENQEIKSFVNVTISGNAKELIGDTERSKAISLLAGKSLRFKERAEKGQLEGTSLFRIDPDEIKVVNLGKGLGDKAIEIIKI